MKILMRFIRPYRGLAAAALLFVFLDVAGALVIPTITADLINVGVGTGNMDYIIEKGILMMAVTVLAGGPVPCLAAFCQPDCPRCLGGI
mgnify:CR=1 FL=1